MESEGSVSVWIGQLKLGDPEAAQKIWDRYMTQLLHMARAKLQALPRAAADEEDVALSAFNAFCMGAQRDGFSRLNDRDDLWQLLFVITESKANNLRKHARRKKRDVGRVVSLSENEAGLDFLASPEPSPALACALAEQCQALLDALGDDELRFVALRKLEGYSNQEIAAKLGYVPRSVERRLRLIREIWSQKQSEHEQDE